ncbi:MAG: amino acid permease [Nanoarchaeota archaeon]|nr:amino acid permease [Nanoarchaeota archaeon]MBU1269822.1 amino acid permease [Nanoarchaeota archaeon]MBU1604877.1 amino acid permease [Nanoarchaeota archaeon]MBU2443154.1 amino acid permease [Nanoarchaeota archaeon]
MVEEKAELKSTLSFPVILIITVNSIMGTGIFFLPAMGALIAGPASLISWGVLAIISIYIAMCFGELASMFPTSGGIYEYCKQAYGNFTSFVIGWMTLIAGNITIAMLIVGAIRYLNPAMPEVYKIGISLLFVLVFNYMAFSGMQTSAVMLVAFGIITMSSLVGLIIPGIINFEPSNLEPFFPYSLPMIFIAIFFIAETFFGWETATFLAEETKNPRKVIPKALVYGTIIIAIISLLFVITAIGTMPWQEFANSKAPLADLSLFHFGEKGKGIFTIMVYLSIIGSVAGWIVSAPRLILALAKDKLFISQCAKIHPKNKTPHIAILFQTILTSLLVVIGSGSYETLLEILLPMVLVIYSLTLLSVVVLRFKMPNVERPYKVIFGKTGPVIVIIMMLSLIAYWISHVDGAVHIVKIGLSFILFGIPLYFLLLFYYDPDAIVKINNFFAYFNLMFENLFLPKQIRRDILSMFKDLERKHVLDYGTGVGTLTLYLAKAVGPNGKVYATDISKKNIDIVSRRTKKRGYSHVHTIHDSHHTSRVHPDIKYVDMVFSVGTMSYIQNIKKILSDMRDILPDRGKVLFVEYVDFFKVIPNIEWLSSNEKIEKVFKDAGFSVRVIRKKGLFWNYIFVYGMKTDSDIPFI